MSNITKYEQQHKDLETLKAMARVAFHSGKYNANDYNEATILNIFMTARALGVDPMLALNGGFNIIKGKINMGAHFMSALARRKGHSIKVVEMTHEKCIIIAKRKDNEDSLKYEMTMEEAVRAGLANKDNWRNNPKQMLYCACVRNVFRILFSDIAIPYDADEMNVEEALKQPEDIGVMEIQAEAVQIEPKAKEVASEAFPDKEPLDELRRHLDLDEIPSARLEEWIDLRSRTKNQPPEMIIQTCLDPAVISQFKKSFKTWIGVPDIIQAAAS